MTQTTATNKQVPDNAILDAYNKQTYLGNQFIYGTSSLQITTTAESPFLLLSNPSVTTAGFPSAYQALFCNIRKIISVTAAQSAILRYYINPTVTGAGTPATAINLRPASPITSIATIATSPMVSANGTFLTSLSSLAFNPDMSSNLIVLDPGQVMLVTIQTSSATTFISSELGWYQL